MQRWYIMEIIDKRKQKPVCLKDIEPGEVFETPIPDWWYLKLHTKEDYRYNVVSLLTGDLEYLPEYQRVMPSKGECVIRMMDDENEDE